MRNRVLVLGGTGFIGSHLVRRLVKMGEEVHVTSRMPIAVRNVRLADCLDVEIHELDIRHRADVFQFKRDIKTFDQVYHLAAYHHVGASWEHPTECMETNVIGTVNVIDAFEESRILYMSTSEVYGLQDSVPWHEDMTPRPQSPYAISKYAGELYAHCKNVRVVRPFNVYGPWQGEGAIIPDLIGKMLRGIRVNVTRGEQTREFNYVEDIVDGLILAMNRVKSWEGALNLCSGHEVTIQGLVKMLMRLTDAKAGIDYCLAYRPNEIWRMAGNVVKASVELDWTATTPLEEGLLRTIEWMKTRGA